jgi:hypothetical protein
MDEVLERSIVVECSVVVGLKLQDGGTFSSHGPPQVYQPASQLLLTVSESSHRVSDHPCSAWPRQPPSSIHNRPRTNDHGFLDSGASCNSHLQTKSFTTIEPRRLAFPIALGYQQTSRALLMVTTSSPKISPSISAYNFATSQPI